MSSLTVKRTEFLFKRITRCMDQLSRDLNEAHRLGLIKYPDDQYKDQAPCSSLWSLENRFEKTTTEALAQMYRRKMRGYK